VAHGVNDNSWAKIPVKEYGDHLSYLKSLSEKRSLWVANLSDVLAYSYLRKKYSPSVKYDGKGRIEFIDFESMVNTPSDSYYQALNTSGSKTITLVINQDHKVKHLIQKNKKLSYEWREKLLLVNADPQAGTIHLSY
jgi:hypothetical protein